MKSFEEWTGHKKIIGSLQKSIEKNQISHAYIFEGPEGMGKLQMAELLAKTLQCEQKGSNPCNMCSSCIQFDSHNHPDIKYVQMQPKKKSLGVEDIRQQIEADLLEKPYRYEKKIYIISKADKMTEQAQNALLKTIEEPPPYGMLILLANAVHGFLPTILSRCIVLRFHPYTPTEMERYITSLRQDVTKEEINMIIGFAEGNPGKGRDLLLSEEFKALRQTFFMLLEKMNTAKGIDIFSIGKVFEKEEKDLPYLLDLMLMWHRDMLLAKLLGEQAKILNIDKKTELFAESKKVGQSMLQNRLRLLQEVKQQLKQNANVQLAVEVLLLRWNEA